jgi:hypothetical protein
MSAQHLKNIKTLIDLAIARGLFNTGESVQFMLDSYRYIAYAVEVFENYGDLSLYKYVGPNNSERTMPGKSNIQMGESMPLTDEDHDKYFPNEPKRVGRTKSEMPGFE